MKEEVNVDRGGGGSRERKLIKVIIPTVANYR